MSPHAGALIEWKSRVRSRVIGQQSERPVNNDSPCELAREGRGGEGRKGRKAAQTSPNVYERQKEGERLESLQPQTIRPLSGSPGRHGI